MKTKPNTRTRKTSHHLSPVNHRDTVRLSDNAFYLIVLASLLKKAVEPGSLMHMLQPGVPSGLGNSPAC